ncbi:MAG: hypothetical protein EPO21_18205 [Chloroflexota bacterium]|nr:MAG: hypothetical protein EPO21_18205 [Chloroflexota bacterium]
MADWRATAIQHVAINVTDFERSLGFYRDMLGMTVAWDREFSGPGLSTMVGLVDARTRVAMLTMDNAAIEIFQYVSPPSHSLVARVCDIAITHVGLIVTDINKAYEELLARGVLFNCPPQYIEAGPMKGWTAVYCKDPDGIIVELMQAPSAGD